MPVFPNGIRENVPDISIINDILEDLELIYQDVLEITGAKEEQKLEVKDASNVTISFQSTSSTSYYQQLP